MEFAPILAALKRHRYDGIIAVEPFDYSPDGPGVAVLASLFAHYGGYRTGTTFVDGMTPAVYVGAAVVALGSLAAFGIKRAKRVEAEALEAVALCQPGSRFPPAGRDDIGQP